VFSARSALEADRRFGMRRCAEENDFAELASCFL